MEEKEREEAFYSEIETMANKRQNEKRLKDLIQNLEQQICEKNNEIQELKCHNNNSNVICLFLN